MGACVLTGYVCSPKLLDNAKEVLGYDLLELCVYGKATRGHVRGLGRVS